jgi:hypothetical protein
MSIPLPSGGRLLPLLSCALGLVATPLMAVANGDTEAFQAHVALAVKNPAEFGFADAEEARRARLGWSYPYYSTVEWASLAESRQASGTAVESAPRQLTEVLGADGTPRCAFIQARAKDRSWGPGVLGFKNLRKGLTVLSRHARREHLVLLVNSETRQLLFADEDVPGEIQRVDVE